MNSTAFTMGYCRSGLSALAWLLLASAPLRAGFRMPRVDVVNNEPGAASTVAVWSYSTQMEAAGDTIAVYFPQSFGTSGFNFLGNVFLKYTVPGTGGSFASSELTITSGSLLGPTPWGQEVQMALPVTIDAGTFYVRFDQEGGITNPQNEGSATLLLGDPDGVITSSRSFYIGSQTTASLSFGTVEGQVHYLQSTTPVVGALVYLSTQGGLPSNYLGPRVSATVEAMDTTVESYSAVTDANGNYSFCVPCSQAGTTFNMNGEASVVDQQDGVTVVQPLDTFSQSPSFTLTPGTSVVVPPFTFYWPNESLAPGSPL